MIHGYAGINEILGNTTKTTSVVTDMAGNIRNQVIEYADYDMFGNAGNAVG